MKAQTWTWILVASAGLVGCDRPVARPGGIPMETQAVRRVWETPHAVGEHATSMHYEIYSTSSRETLQQILPGFMEAAHRNYESLTALESDGGAKRMPIYMMGSRQEWSDLTEMIITTNTDTYLSIEAGGYCHRGVCVFWDLGGTTVLAIAAHEGLHQFFHHHLEDGLPMWLEEGLCVTMEGMEFQGDYVRFTPNHNPLRFNDLRSALVQGRWIPIRKLLPMDAGHVVTKGPYVAVGYYGQLWGLSMYIRSVPAYRAGLERLLADAKAGTFHQALGVPKAALGQLRRRGRIYNQTVSEKLFRHYITDDLDAFDKEYRAFAMAFLDLQ